MGFEGPPQPNKSEQVEIKSEQSSFDQSELNRKQRREQKLPPESELDGEINRAEGLVEDAEYEVSIGKRSQVFLDKTKRILEEVLQKKRDILAGRPAEEYRPETQTQTQREPTEW